MDRRIRLETAPSVISDSGDEQLDWAHATVLYLWAEWLPAGTTEAYRAQQRLGSYVDGVFRIHDRSPRPTPNNTRIIFDGRIFDLKPYVELGRHDGLEIPVVASGS